LDTEDTDFYELDEGRIVRIRRKGAKGVKETIVWMIPFDHWNRRTANRYSDRKAHPSPTIRFITPINLSMAGFHAF